MARQLRSGHTCCSCSCAILQSQTSRFVFACNKNSSHGSKRQRKLAMKTYVKKRGAAPVKPDVSDTSNLLEDLAGAVNGRTQG
jgi:tRNA(Arg) A34 adenosine deaminase TadA